MQITAVRTLTAPLSAPALTPSVSGTTATLNWTAPTPTGQSVIAGYRVYKSSTVGGTYTQIGGNLPANQLSLTDTLSGTSFYKVEAFDQFVTGNRSGGVQCSPMTGSIVFKPGHRVMVGYSNMPSFASIKSTCDSLFGPGGSDINNQISGICISPTFAQCEGPALGQYTTGDAAIAQIIALLKSYTPPRDLTLRINGGGNGYSSISSTAFQSSFCPAYMNAGAKGSPTDQYGGGEVHLQSDGVTPLDRPYIVIWNQNVVNREIALVQHWYQTFGPDTPTGGIYRIDPYHEISVNANAPGYSVSSISATFPSWMAGLRAAAPRMLIMVKPTFINPNNGATYGSTIVPAMLSNHISMSCEDCAPLHDWGMKAFLGMWASTPVNHATAGDWDYHCNIDPAELWKTSNGTAAIPPATYGSGLFYDGAPANPGIMTTVNQLNASHVDWYIDGFGGPNVVRRTPGDPKTTPANPTPGPGAGLTSARPNIIDVLTANMAYPGMISSGLAIPGTTYPSSYP